MRKSISKTTKYAFTVNDFITFMRAQASIGPGQTNVNIEWTNDKIDTSEDYTLAMLTVTE